MGKAYDDVGFLVALDLAYYFFRPCDIVIPLDAVRFYVADGVFTHETKDGYSDSALVYNGIVAHTVVSHGFSEELRSLLVAFIFESRLPVDVRAYDLRHVLVLFDDGLPPPRRFVEDRPARRYYPFRFGSLVEHPCQAAYLVVEFVIAECDGIIIQISHHPQLGRGRCIYRLESCSHRKASGIEEEGVGICLFYVVYLSLHLRESADLIL